MTDPSDLARLTLQVERELEPTVAELERERQRPTPPPPTNEEKNP